MLKTINIIATAAFPWRTGPAISALLRTFYLAQKGLDVRLYVPWIPVHEQPLIFGKEVCFHSFEEQEECMRSYLPEPHCSSLQVEFYPATYKANWGSILPTCLLSKEIRQCDWLILEEPEHLNWKHPWNRYSEKASRVTGIVLTNYLYYSKHAFPHMPIIPWALNHYNRWLIQHHCDDAITLSNAISPLSNSQPLYSSGIHPSFLETPSVGLDSNKIYFIGKLIWEKGLRELIDLLSITQTREIDVFGIGKDQETINAYAQHKGILLHFQGNSSNPAKDLQDYKIFINASRSEVACTTTAEALGQGKFVIIPDIPGNDEYYRFKNCLVYSTPQEFNSQLKYALEHVPEEDTQINELTWEASTDRLLQYYWQVENQLNGQIDPGKIPILSSKKKTLLSEK